MQYGLCKKNLKKTKMIKSQEYTGDTEPPKVTLFKSKRTK